MSKSDAPNYGDASGHERCGTCAYFKDGHCTMFDFDADPGFTCDSWVSNEETHTAGGRSVVEKHAAFRDQAMDRTKKRATAASVRFARSRGAKRTKKGDAILKRAELEKLAFLEASIYRGDIAEARRGRAALAQMRNQKLEQAQRGGLRGRFARNAARALDKDIQRHDAYIRSLTKTAASEKVAVLGWLKGMFKKQPDPMKVLQAAKKKARYGGADLYGKTGGPAAPAVQLERLKAARNIQKTARVLSAQGRRQISEGNFALPGRRYPIHDRSHARNALSRVAQHGTPAEKARVRAAVAARYPGIGQEKKAMKIPKIVLPTISRGSRRALASAGVGTAAGGAGGFVGGEVHGKKEMRGSMFTPQEVQYAYRKGQADVIRAIRSRQASSMKKVSHVEVDTDNLTIPQDILGF